MIFTVIRVLFRPIVRLHSDRVGIWITRLWPILPGKAFEAKLTDKSLEFLLRLVDLSLNFSEDFRRDIKDFRGKLVFKTEKEKGIASSVVFGDGKMIVMEDEISDPNVTVIFKTADALRRFMFSRDLDAMDLMLKNEIQIDGNWNYVHKFLSIVKDLLNRLGY